MSLLVLLLLPAQEASPRLPARLSAAGNAAVRVAVATQKGEEGASREGQERTGDDAEKEQSQEDEVNKGRRFTDQQNVHHMHVHNKQY